MINARAGVDSELNRVAKKPTMTEIAAACGVSQATVSLVLNNAPGTRISASTRDAVLHKAHELGYESTRRTGDRRPLIIMMINDVTSSPHVSGLIAGVSDAASELGYVVALLPSLGDIENEQAALDYLSALPVAGVIYTRLITQEVALPAALSGMPLVLLNCHASGNQVPSVVPGDLAGGLTATLNLIDAGHQRIAYIGGEDSIEASRERLKGYKRALVMRDIAADPALVAKGGWTIRGGYKAMTRLLALPSPPTAVFCFCDRTAMGVYNAATALGRSIPQDLSVIGFDNEAFAADMLPPLTTMELPHSDMARHAVEQLAAIFNNPRNQSRHLRMKFDCPLIQRRSVVAPAKRSELA